MSLFSPAPKPATLLGYHRILSPTAGVRVSPLCLGGANFGENWKAFTGECTKETAFEILDYFWENGGNFIDTANNYQGEQSEQWIGEWMQARQNRDEIVLATKFTTGYRTIGAHEKVKANFQGNHAKSIHVSVKASLKKLQTDYIDLLYLHWWDFTTSIPELMNTLHHLVAAGKVLYLGISDTPAWIVVKCNDYARFHGLTQFSVYQGMWNAAKRDFERDIIPMVHEEGMALAPWGSLGQGKFKSREAWTSREDGRKTGDQPDHYVRVAAVLEEIAKKKGPDVLPTSIALAYGNIEALGVELSEEEMEQIDAAEPFDVGFPMNWLFESDGKKYKPGMGPSEIALVNANTRLESVAQPKPIESRLGEKKALADEEKKGNWKVE